MILDAARAAFRNLLAPELRSIFFKTLGLTILSLIAGWFGLKELFDWAALPWIDALLPSSSSWTGWFNLIAALLAGIGLAIGLALLIAPVTAMIAGLFLDDVAEAVERRDYAIEPVGKALPIGTAIVQSLKFFGIVILGNLIALLLLFIPGINVAAFFVVNGYLLGREFFEFAAMRHMPQADAKALRRRHSGTVFLAGLLIAAIVSVPLLNLLAPFLAAAMMVHLFKMLSAKDPGRGTSAMAMRAAA